MATVRSLDGCIIPRGAVAINRDFFAQIQLMVLYEERDGDFHHYVLRAVAEKGARWTFSLPMPLWSHL